MSAKILFYLTALFLLPFAGCGDRHHGVAVEVQLDNGKKWAANPETTQGIANMVAQINAFQGTDEAGYDQLASQLNNEFQLIFKNCTMKGEGHEQLHNFLLPMKAMVEGLEEGPAAERHKSLETLGQHLAGYSNYFE